MIKFNSAAYEEARARLGLPHSQLAAAAGLTNSTLTRWRQGSTSPRLAELSGLASVLGVPLQDLVLPGPAPTPRPYPHADLHSGRRDRAGLDSLSNLVGRLVTRRSLNHFPLTRLERLVLIARFGLDLDPPRARTLDSIAAELGVSRQRVAQLEAAALRRLI